MSVCLSVSQNLDKAIWSHLVPNLVTPCTRPCHTLYQTLQHLVPDFVTPCTKSCRSLYQTVAHLVADPGTSCTRPWHILYQILAHLVPDPGTPCTRPCHTLYQTLARPHASYCLSNNKMSRPPLFSVYFVVTYRSVNSKNPALFDRFYS